MSKCKTKSVKLGLIDEKRTESVNRIVGAFNGKTLSSHEDFIEVFKRCLSAAYSDGFIDCSLDNNDSYDKGFKKGQAKGNGSAKHFMNRVVYKEKINTIFEVFPSIKNVYPNTEGYVWTQSERGAIKMLNKFHKKLEKISNQLNISDE